MFSHATHPPKNSNPVNLQFNLYISEVQTKIHAPDQVFPEAKD